MAAPGALRLDREYVAVLASLGDIGMPELPVGDIEGRRKRFEIRSQRLLPVIQPAPDVLRRRYMISCEDGGIIALEEFRPKDAPVETSPAIYHVHGGGMILGSVESFSISIATKAFNCGLPVFSIDYRLAPEHRHPTPVNDCYAGLQWLYANAGKLGVDCNRVMVQGDSAGGGIAAGTVIMARDKHLSPPIAYQMLFYPMLDDRNLAPQPSIEPYTKWKSNDNRTGWGGLLGGAAGQDDEVDGHQHAAPARARTLSGLPPTYIDVGQLDIFAKESIDYAKRLLEAGIQVELHVYPGLPHDFEWVGSRSKVVESALNNRQRAVENFKFRIS